MHKLICHMYMRLTLCWCTLDFVVYKYSRWLEVMTITQLPFLCLYDQKALHIQETFWLTFSNRAIILSVSIFTVRKIPAQRWLEPQATCCLGMCHRSHTLTGMELSSAFYHTWTSVTSHGCWRLILHYEQLYGHQLKLVVLRLTSTHLGYATYYHVVLKL